MNIYNIMNMSRLMLTFHAAKGAEASGGMETEHQLMLSIA